MIRSNLLARRVAAAAAGPVSASRAAAMPSSSTAVDALVNCHYHGASSSATSAARFPTIIAPSHHLLVASSRRNFSADSAATELGSILTREIEEEEEAASEFDGKLPPEFAELDAEIRKKWTVLEGISGIGGASGETGSGATMRMFRKESGSKGAKIGIVFHCQDTEEDVKFDEEDFMNQAEGGEVEEEEQAQAVRFGVTVSKGGKTVVIQSRAGASGEVGVETVVVRDGDAEGVLAALAGGEGTHAALYQGPEFTELSEDLQESFQRYIVEECGVDDDVMAYISMYVDYREQVEYVSWMKTAVDILD